MCRQIDQQTANGTNGAPDTEKIFFQPFHRFALKFPPQEPKFYQVQADLQFAKYLP